MTVFNANQHVPQQIGGKHPVGNKFPFVITGTEVKDVKEKQNKLFEVTLTSPAGSIKNNYNLWNDSDVARKIAVGQLSALCHATGIFMVNFSDPIKAGPDGRELLNGKGLMDIGFQDGQGPTAEKPEGGYVEVKKVYDVNGNEPGKGTAQPQQQANPQQQAAPQVQQGWTQGANQPNPAPNTAGGWQQGTSTGEKPPWG
jgi:hypothetical protein